MKNAIVGFQIRDLNIGGYATIYLDQKIPVNSQEDMYTAKLKLIEENGLSEGEDMYFILRDFTFTKHRANSIKKYRRTVIKVTNRRRSLHKYAQGYDNATRNNRRETEAERSTRKKG